LKRLLKGPIVFEKVCNRVVERFTARSFFKKPTKKPTVPRFHHPRDEFLLAATVQNLRKLAKLIPLPAPMPA